MYEHLASKTKSMVAGLKEQMGSSTHDSRHTQASHQGEVTSHQGEQLPGEQLHEASVRESFGEHGVALCGGLGDVGTASDQIA